MPSDNLTKKQLLDYLEHPHAHAPLNKAAADFPINLMNKKPRGAPYTAWGLLEHIRVAQHDMVDFMQNPNYQSLDWPADYWPNPKQKADQKMWMASVAGYQADVKALIKIVKNPKTNLNKKIAWGQGQTILREILQIIDHTSYHTGELIFLRRIMGNWK